MNRYYYYSGSFTLIFLLLLFWSFFFIPVGWLILLLFVFSSPSIYVYTLAEDGKEVNDRKVVRADL